MQIRFYLGLRSAVGSQIQGVILRRNGCDESSTAPRKFQMISTWAAQQVRMGCFIGLAMLAARLMAHEGHKPLPAKGVEVNAERGSVLLTQPARDALGVVTAEVALESCEDRVQAYARLVSPWQQRAYVASQIRGKISRLYVQPGDVVAAGQPLAGIDSPELQDLQLDLINAQNAWLLSQKLVEHFQSIGTGAVAGSKLQAAETNHRENTNTLETTQIKLLNLGFSTDQIEKLRVGGESQRLTELAIRSPIAGTAYHSDLSIGKVVDPAEHLFEVVDLSSVWGKIEILERDLQLIAVGQSVEITLPAYPGETFRGEITVKESYLDPVTHLGTAWIDLPNPPERTNRFLPGMFGQAQVIIAAPDKFLTVPEIAVARDGAERFVLVQEESTDRSSQYIKRNVVVVRHAAGKVQFRAEQVFPGDRVVTVGTHELFNFFVQGVLRLSREARENIGLRTETVEDHSIGAGFAMDGLIELPPVARDSVSSQLGGTLERIQVTRGQFVHRGEAIGELASLEFQDLQLQLVTAQNDLNNLTTILQRWEASRESQAIPQRQRWETESQLRFQQNLKDNLQRKLETIGLNHEQIESLITEKKFVRSLPIRATIDGYVVGFDKVIGQFLAEGEMILEVHDPKQARIRGFMTESELTRVKIGQAARIRLAALPDFVGQAVVISSGQGLDSTNRTLSVWLEFNELPTILLQHGMLARINLISETDPATLAVSNEAIVNEADGQFVFVQTADGKFDRRLIETGRSDDRYVEITAGLAAGEIIAAWGVSDLHSAYASLR